jgi:hypothetical protein
LLEVEGTTMGWTNTFWASGVSAPVDPSDETVVNGVPYDAARAIRRGADKFAAPVDRADPQISDETKRRQIALAVRYVAMVRAH